MPSKHTASDQSHKTPPVSGKAAAKLKAGSAKAKAAPKASSASPPKSTSRSAETATAKAASHAAKSPSAVTKTTPAGKPARGPAGEESSANLLARAEADLTVLLESLNNQMSAAMHALTDLAIAQKGGRGHEAVVRTRPLDRATAMFQRLVAELLDERLAELLPTIINLRNEMDQRARAAAAGSQDGEFLQRGREMLDQVLAAAETHTYQPRLGEPYDPLIHLAVGETFRDDLADGVVSEVFQPGFRSARGKVVVAARVKVNRR